MQPNFAEVSSLSSRRKNRPKSVRDPHKTTMRTEIRAISRPRTKLEARSADGGISRRAGVEERQ